MARLLLGSEEEIPFFQAGRLGPATALRVAQRYQWLAIGLVLGNAVTLLVAFVLALVLLLSQRGSAALVGALLLLAVVQLGIAVWIWMTGSSTRHLPVQRMQGKLDVSRRANHLRLGEREFRLLGQLQAAPEVGRSVSAYWVQAPFQRAPLAVALLDEGPST